MYLGLRGAPCRRPYGTTQMRQSVLFLYETNLESCGLLSAAHQVVFGGVWLLYTQGLSQCSQLSVSNGQYYWNNDNPLLWVAEVHMACNSIYEAP
jgi:hypothetical protein